MGILALLLAFALPCSAESITLNQFGGQNDSVNAASIGDNQAQAALNVELNKAGTAVVKRGGLADFLSVSGKTSVDSIFAFRNQSGNECFLIAMEGTVYRSVNSATPVQVTTITSGARLNCSDYQGTAYCFSTSNDLPFSDNCTTYQVKQASAYPNGKFSTFLLDRQLIAGTSDYPNRLNISKSGDFSGFNAGVETLDSWYEDIGLAGEKITGLRYLNGRVIVFKEYSIGAMMLTDQYSSQFYDISNNVGMADHVSAVVHNGLAYFKGSDNKFYILDGTPGGIKDISLDISSTTANILTGKSRYNIQTEKDDWDAGNLIYAGAGAPMRTDIVIGSVMGSSITFTDSFGTDASSTTINLVNLTTGDASGYVTLSSTVVKDDFRDGNYTTNPVWTVTAGAFTVSSNRLNANSVTASNTANTPSTLSSGSWKFDHYFYDQQGNSRCTYTNGDSCMEFRFMKNNGDDYYSAGFVRVSDNTYDYRVSKNISGVSTILTSSFTTSSLYAAGVDHHWEVQRSTDGRMMLYVGSVLISSSTDVSITSSTRIEVTLSLYKPIAAVYTGNSVGSIYSYHYKSSGTLISKVFDTTFTTPTAGPFRSTFTCLTDTSVFSTGESAIFYDTQQSPDNATWGAWISSSDTVRTTLTQRYWRYRARFLTLISTKTPAIDEISLVAATTGAYVTQCIQPGSGISAWGALEASYASSCGGITFSASTGASCGVAGGVWTVQSTGTTISVAVGPAIKVRTEHSLDASTCTSRLDSITINWNEGSVAPPSPSAVWNGSVYWGVSNSSQTNNLMLKYDILHNAWFPFDVRARSLYSYNNIFYVGGNITGKVYKLGNMNSRLAPASDSGASIDAYWKSKEFSGPDPFTENIWQNLSTIWRDEDGGSATVTWQTDGGKLTDSYSVSLSTGDNVVRHNRALPFGRRGSFFNVRVGNNSTSPFELIGVKIDLTPEKWRPMP